MQAHQGLAEPGIQGEGGLGSGLQQQNKHRVIACAVHAHPCPCFIRAGVCIESHAHCCSCPLCLASESQEVVFLPRLPLESMKEYVGLSWVWP